MPHRQIHRGPAPDDEPFFAVRRLAVLREAARDLCWLLDRGYASHSAVVLVGNRHALTSRERMAIGRFACTEEAVSHRNARRLNPEGLGGRELWIDGYNVLTILETALAGGVVLVGRDGCCRDIAGVHRRYRKVQETVPVLQLIGALTASWGVTGCRWWLDKPVSNSGRLKALILEIAAAAGWNAAVELVFNPDRVLAETDQVIATSDGVILDRCRHWVNLTRTVVAEKIPRARIVDLSVTPGQLRVEPEPA